MKKTAVLLSALLAGALLAYTAAGPFITLYQIRSALDARDAGKLSQYVGFPVLRENLKAQINALIVTKVRASVADNPFSVFGLALAGTLVDSLVEGAETIDVSFQDGFTVRAKIVGLDKDSDIALIQVDSKGLSLRPLELAKIDEVFVGQRAIAIGNPFGQTWTLTTGIVSAIGRTIQSGNLGFSIPEVIQTDAAINPGNSGGPLLNSAGQVIGVNTQIISESRSSAGIGFAVPSSIVSQVTPSLLQGKSYVYPYLGIQATDLTLDMIESMQLDAKQRGTQVIRVMDGGAADLANIRQSEREITVQGESIPVDGDVIVAINGSKVNGIADLITYLVKNVSAGEDATLTILRAGKQMEVKVTLQPRPTQ